MSLLAWQCTCLDCGGDLRTVNPGATYGHRSVAVVACLDCGAEWCPEVNLARVSRPRARPAGRTRSTSRCYPHTDRENDRTVADVLAVLTSIREAVA